MSIDVGKIVNEDSVEKESGEKTIEKAKFVGKQIKLVLNAANTIYPIVRKISKNDLKMKVIEEIDNENFDLMWSDHAVQIDRLLKFKPH